MQAMAILRHPRILCHPANKIRNYSGSHGFTFFLLLIRAKKTQCILEMRGLNFLAEFFGTFLLLMSILTTGNFAIIGLTLAATIFLVGNVSGANLNPAVSLAMYLSGKLDIVRFLGYSLAQMLGGAAAFYSYTYVKGLRASK